jgi:hypothetical protein
MALKKNNIKERQIGKRTTVRKPLIDPRYKNTAWSIAIVVILVIFFIVNNTVSVPEQGPYPPAYNSATQDPPSKKVSTELEFNYK